MRKLLVVIVGIVAVVIAVAIGALAALGVNGILPAGSPYLGILAGIILGAGVGWTVFVIGMMGAMLASGR